MRVEHASGSAILTQFELEAQKKIAVYDSPLERLDREEKKRSLEYRQTIYREVLKRVKMTKRQRTCFEQVILKGMDFGASAKSQGVDPDTVRTVIERLKHKIGKATGRFVEGVKLSESPGFRLLTTREQLLFRLYYRELMRLSDIARKLGLDPSSVRKSLKHAVEKKLKK